MSLAPPPCSLCASLSTRPLLLDGSRQYWRCDDCGLSFLDASAWLSHREENLVYDQHENDVHDPGYRRFLSKLAEPLLERLAPGSEGLDYGCGPGPALAAMLTEAGHVVSLYDPFYEVDPTALERKYDFVMCTEVAEHFCDPRAEFERLDDLLRPGGWLALMTCFQVDDTRFDDWYYRRDPTHVVFYAERTLRALAERMGWSLVIVAKDVALFRRPG